MKVGSFVRGTTIFRAARILSPRDRKKVIAVVILQVGLSLLDLFGVAIIGVLGALAVSGVESHQTGNRVNTVLSLLHIADLKFQSQAAILGIIAATLLITRTVFSILFTRRTLFFLSRRGAKISGDLVAQVLSQPLLDIQKRTSQETLYAVTTGVGAIVLGIIGTAVQFVSDGSLLIVMAIGLFLVDPIIAFGTFTFFALLGFFLYKLMYIRAQNLGKRNGELAWQSSERILEVLSSYRESLVRNRRDFYSREIRQTRMELADISAEMTFMPNISKYIIESSVILGAFLISATQFILQDATHAVATLAVFLAAGTRIAPAVLRLQQGAVSIRACLGSAGPTLELIESFTNAELAENSDDEVDIDHIGFKANIELENLNFTYSGNSRPAISNINLKIDAGSSVAFVGPSGAGKTTIVDVLLGVIVPDTGSIRISGLSPLDAFAEWPGAVSYVPQDVLITNGTIRENVGFGYPKSSATDELVFTALEIAQLKEFSSDLVNGIDNQVGERGTRISGGQRQRLGIARAMFTRPLLLVLDEATSSLDGVTEESISKSIQSLKGKATVVMIAHRLSTVRNVDILVYMKEGEILATGTFEQVRALVPDFDTQAKLMGL